MKTILLFTVISTLSIHLFGQANWMKDPQNPVMVLDSDWEQNYIAPGSVLKIDNTYHMWYSGGAFVSGFDFSIGHAVSDDETTWIKDANNPILRKGIEGEWDDHAVFRPSVLFIDTIYHMWYSGKSDESKWLNIGHATSMDGVNWEKDPANPVLTISDAGSWDDSRVAMPSVVFDGLTFHLYYGGFTGDGYYSSIGHATSTDGSDWTKDPGNPVLTFGTSGEWDRPEIDIPAVIFDGSSFHMWYHAGEFLQWSLGYATSEDGSIWTKHPEAILTPGESGTWDESQVSSPVVRFINEGDYELWYRGANAGGTGSIGYATSSTVGIQHQQKDEILLYPNPARDIITIQLKEVGTYSVELLTSSGQEVLNKKFTGSSLELDLSSSKTGLYFITIRGIKSVWTAKVVLQ